MLQNRLGKELLIFDGAMGTQLQNAGLSAGDIPEELNIDRPDLLRSIHKNYLKAGADFITTNTFGCNRLKMEEAKYEPEMDINEEEYITDDEKGYEIKRENEKYVISGSWIEAVGGSVNFSDQESLQYFQRALLKRGVIEDLINMGIKEGEIVQIGDLEFEFVF